MKRALVTITFGVAIAACHSSCTEETGAAPVVEAGATAEPALGARRIAPNIRPAMRATITPLNVSPAPSASANGN